MLRVLGALVVAASLASLLHAISEHDAERLRWETERAAIHTPAYNAQASDAAYAKSRGARRRAGLCALLLVVGMWGVLATGEPKAGAGVHASNWRRNGASVVDLGLGIAILALVSIDDGESAIRHALVMAAPAAAIAIGALTLQHGCTLGMVVTKLRSRPVSPWRALGTTLMLPLAIAGLLRPSWSALHWRLGAISLDVASHQDAE